MSHNNSPLVRLFSIEYPSEYRMLIRNGITVDEDLVRDRLEIEKQPSIFKRIFHWLANLWDYYDNICEIATTQEILSNNRNLLPKEQIKELEEKIDRLKLKL